MKESNQEQVKNAQLSIHWWNMREKTLDYKGSYEGCLAKKGITYKKFNNKNGRGFEFKIPLASSLTTHRISGTNIISACDEAIGIYLYLLGDKAIFQAEHHIYKFNY